MSPNESAPRFDSRYQLDLDQIQGWVESFHRDGYLFLEEVLTQQHIAQLRGELDWALANLATGPGDDHAKVKTHKSAKIMLCNRMFETSPANLALFDMEPIVSLAEALIDGPCHVIHNNAFITPPGGGITGWHQDDPPHYLVTDGEPPTNVRLPVLAFTCNYYLTDVTAVEHGGTEVIPASHLFGADARKASVDGDFSQQIRPNLGKAGSVVLFNNQVWHRGGPNRSQRSRYVSQITYARRLVGHKYYPFMNYQMPEQVYRGADERRRRLLGFLGHGAYG